jgi:predicted transcriptional regulator
MKTAISIPDDVFRRAERFAKRRKLSRSEMYTAALVRMLEAEPKEDVTRAYDSAFDDDQRDILIDTAARRLLTDIEWTEE